MAAVRPQRFAWLQLILGSDDTATAAAGSAARTALGDDAVGGSALPNCPASDTALGRWNGGPPQPCSNADFRSRAPPRGGAAAGWEFSRPGGVLYHPTVVFTYALIALTCFGIAAYTLAKFNSVTVFNRKIRTPSISNTPWIIFYVLSGLRQALIRAHAVRASVQPQWSHRSRRGEVHVPARKLCPPSASCSCVRYGLNTVATPDDILDVVLLLAALALDGFALLALALALQHQRLHRSGSTSGEPERECETPHVCCPDEAD